jgi:hypothetical protein
VSGVDTIQKGDYAVRKGWPRTNPESHRTSSDIDLLDVAVDLRDFSTSVARAVAHEGFRDLLGSEYHNK